ncbi:hypothetical protein H7H48_05745 [Nitratireductor sp. B36]|uniref:hypothetical protein n=1 Tax=Nitratireductor sp. B36 TaxID=2762059 RepID=UPI001E2CA689|nr:hypothetical protein [Nitratireductor sp. B36]MCC5778546.1 hypothetical protein [Nitratireductor sp. B36]
MTWDLAVGQFAPIISGILGLTGSALLVLPSIMSSDSRMTMLQLQRLQTSRTQPNAYQKQMKQLLDRALKEMGFERRCLRVGLLLLCVSFLMLALHGVANLA